MSDKKRAGEEGVRRHFRAERFSVANGKFYFTTREGTLEGPYASREEAERELALYIRRVSGRDIFGSVIKSPGQD